MLPKEQRDRFRGSLMILPWLVIFPFFFVDVPPVLDYPNHLARIFVLGSPNDPILSRFYEPSWHIIPNLAIDLIGPGLVAYLPIHWVGRLLLALSLLLPVGGAIAYGRAAMGRDWSPWLLGATIVAFNGLFLLGFMNFQISIGLALFGAAFWIEHRETSPLVAVAVGAAYAAIIFFSHLFGVFFFALLIGSRELMALWDRGKLLSSDAVGSAGILAAVLLPAVVLYAMSPLGAAPPTMVLEVPAQKLAGLFLPFSGYREAVGAVVGLGVFAIVVLGWRKGRVDRGSMLAMAVLMVAYLLAPSGAKGGSFFDSRFAVMMGFLLFCGFRPGLPFRPGWLLPVAVQTLALIKIVDVGFAWAEQRADLDRFRRVISSVTPGSRVLVVDTMAEQGLRPGEPASRMIPGLHRTTSHLPALLLIEQRSFWPFLFADPSQQPIAVREAFAGLSARNDPPDVKLLDAAADKPPGEGLLDGWPVRFDYVLILHAGAAGDLNAFRSDRLLFRAGSDIAALYAIRKG